MAEQVVVREAVVRAVKRAALMEVESQEVETVGGAMAVATVAVDGMAAQTEALQEGEAAKVAEQAVDAKVALSELGCWVEGKEVATLGRALTVVRVEAQTAAGSLEVGMLGMEEDGGMAVVEVRRVVRRVVERMAVAG